MIFFYFSAIEHTKDILKMGAKEVLELSVKTPSQYRKRRTYLALTTH